MDSSCSWGSETSSGMRMILFFTTLLSVITTAMKAFSSTISRSYRFTVTRFLGAAAVNTGVVADLGEHLARPVNHPVQLLHAQVQGVVDALGLLHGEPVLTHELVHVQPGSPMGEGMRPAEVWGCSR